MPKKNERLATPAEIRKAMDKFFAEDKLDAVVAVCDIVPALTKAQLDEIVRKFA